MQNILDNLNPSQREAVTATEGVIRVIAGAGSGKTRALTYRFAFLVNELGILPGNILCVTFTNKSANEMRQRIHQLTGDNDTGYINTFHGFCVSILQEDSSVVQYPKSFLVLDNSDINAMLQIIYDERGLSLRDMTFSHARDMIEIKKELNPTLPDGGPVICHYADTQDAEAAWMVGEMERLHESGVPYRDMTVLYRAHYVTRAVEEELLKEKLPYTLYSGTQFFDRMEIKDALSYLRMIVYKDDLSFMRVANTPKRNMGKRRMAFLQEFAAKHSCTLYTALRDNLEEAIFKGTKAQQFVALVERFGAGYEGRPVSEVLSELLDESGYEKQLRTEGDQERLDNLAELKQSVYEFETTCGEEVTLEHYLSHVALFTNSDTAEPGDKVKLMTVHAAKGLEFPYVFLCGMNEGIFPSRKVRTLQGMEEERRLAFVALTRAEKGLFLSEADGRNLDGSPRYPSRFILDIDSALLEYTQPPEEGLVRDAKMYIDASSKWLPEDDSSILFSVGERVRHSVFGDGTILDIDMVKSAHVIQFDSMDTPRSISFRAKLEHCD